MFKNEYTAVAENTIIKIESIFVAQPKALTAYLICLSFLFCQRIFEGYLAALIFLIFSVFLVLLIPVVFGIGVFKVVGATGLISGFVSRFSCVTSCTPLTVSREPIQPMTPRYMIRMHVKIRGANASPKTATRSGDPVMDGSLLRNRYALANVKASKATPMKRVVYPEIRALSLIG